jgi:gas vesicle protein
MSDKDSELGSFLAGFVIGGLVGAAAALILAPQSGSETRSQISGKGHELREAGEQTFHEAVETVDDYAHRAGEYATDLGDEIEQRARIVLDEGNAVASEDDGPEPADGNGTTPDSTS